MTTSRVLAYPDGGRASQPAPLARDEPSRAARSPPCYSI
eukprot:CAMPEP_0115869666 /NCGR_PEP_ID=MMETSP0287-20121206/21926_1 /TAXON_ID=412157 /ORGANISM="Chrysochromulina rotalis, Strain UIO044" /LENGTH=38 /DNA_ID= /DNA_START= /DNA_END= /DNA_ORIENTATION=